MNKSPGTIDAIGDVILGIKVETAICANATYLTNGGTSDLFRVHGRVKVLLLEWEAITEASAHAYTMQYKYRSTSPVVATVQISNASSAITSLGQGGRVTLIGTALDTAALLSVQGISFTTSTFLELGIQGGTGIIEALGGGASQTSGTGKWTLCYVPISDGAYVEALIV